MNGPESAIIEVDEVPAQVRGLAVVSFSMNFFALLTFWWIPFGILLAIAASTFGAISILLGVRTVARGLYYPLGGMLIASITIGAALLTTKLSWLLFIEF